VRLQADKSVEDLHSGIFHLARPADVRRLIEARLQFHDGSDFLVRRGRHQRWNNQRISLVR